MTPIRPPASWKHPESHYLEMMDHPWYRLVARLQDAVGVCTVRFWAARGGRMLCLPITTGSISSPMGAGSDSLPVQVELCGVKTYLADSMQFMLELGCRLAREGCYYIMPSFRGEDADARHLCQFVHSEAEIVGGLDDAIGVIEDYVRRLAVDVLAGLGAEVAGSAGDVSHIEHVAGLSRFNRVTFDEAAEVLRGDPRFVRRQPGGWRTLTWDGEQELLGKLGEPLWVTHMDHLSVPFYQAFGGDGSKARNADLLLGIGETVGCGERHATAEALDAALSLHGVAPDTYAWYREMKRRHPMRTAGFGLGVERLLLWMLRHDDIRDIPLLLRMNGQNILP